LVNDVGRALRAQAVLAGVDHEVLAAGHPRDLVAVADLVRGPVEVGRVQEEPLDVRHAAGAQEPRRLAGGERVGRAGIEIDDQAC
jgi:hypothetical protein